MICHFACVEIEKALEEAGISLQKKSVLFDYFPPYRFKRDIETINEYLGVSVTKIILLEHVLNPVKKTMLNKIVNLYFLLDKLGVNKNSWLYYFIDSLELKIYEFWNKYRRGSKGYYKLIKMNWKQREIL